MGIYIEPKRRTWALELRVAEILANVGHFVELLVEGVLPTADMRLDSVEYELKSPERFTLNVLAITTYRGDSIRCVARNGLERDE